VWLKPVHTVIKFALVGRIVLSRQIPLVAEIIAPEPSSLALVMIGATCMFGFARRRRVA